MDRKKECINQLPAIVSIHEEKIELNCSFLDMAEKFALDKGCVALLSGGRLDCSRYHILAVKPWLELTGQQDSLKLKFNGKTFLFQDNPFDFVAKLLKHFKLSNDHMPGHNSSSPVNAGLFGYFSYDLKNSIEDLPQTCIGTGLPDICLYAPSATLVSDKKTKTSNLFIPCFKSSDDSPLDKVSHKNHIDEIRNYFFKKLNEKPPLTRQKSQKSALNKTPLKSTFSKEEYVEQVKKVIKYLKAGDIYQANLSQRFDAEFTGSPFDLFKKLYKKNPASFFAYINADTHQILSTSPERFIRQAGRDIETRPIKGTIARGRTEAEDKNNAEILLSSIKDDAELTMIVDLMRNDLSRVAKPGSVVVKEHKKLEPYDNVYHLVSIVKGELDQNMGSIDLLKATFPGGSITGCPKIRSMEIIDELEPVKRHVYTGSIGYLSFHDTMDLSIAIRTATVFKGRISFSVGGGIVFDSDPEKEYQETLDKGKTIMDLLISKPGGTDLKRDKIWINGKIISQKHARIPVACPGFQYGAGLFETIRVENSKIIRLSEHLKRLNRGLRELFNQDPVDINFKDVISTVIEKNNLGSSLAAVKIILAENENQGEFPFSAMVSAGKYTPRLDLLKKNGLDLIRYPYPRQIITADHKSLNYLYYYLAGIFAKQNNKDEALILNPDMTISETNTCSIMIIKKDTVIIPESEHVLKGVTIAAVMDLLKKKGYEIRYEKIFFHDFIKFSNIILLNALMGAVPVTSIENHKIRYSKKLLEMINGNIVKF